MPAPSRGSTFEQVLGGLGRVLEETGAGSPGKHGAADAVGEAQRVAAAWLVSRMLRPKRINWPRLLAATAAGVVLGEVLVALGSRRNGRSLPSGRSRVLPGGAGAGEAARAEEADDIGPRSARQARHEEELLDAAEEYAEYEMEPGPRSARRARAAREEAEEAAAQVRLLLERIGADLAVGAAYASIAYPRIPGPPMVRAAVFGAADAIASAGGGIANVLSEFSPRMKLPMRRLLSDEERRIERALGLALALGLIYRDKRYDD